MRPLVVLTAASILTSLVHAPPAVAAWVWPLRGEILTSYRNGDDPYAAGQHRGIDIAGAVGTPVVAAAGGEVRFAGTAGSSGLTVSVRTVDGFDTSYLHLAAVHVRPGEGVSAGQRLGAVGTSGVRSAVAPHLHFGVREAGERHAYRDPLALLPPLPVGAPEQPDASPAPAPVPAAPAPAPAPLAAPLPRRVPGARRLPGARPLPRARRVPARRGVPARPRIPSARPAPAPRPLPDARPRAAPVADARPVREGLPGRRAGSASRSAPVPRETTAPGLGPAPNGSLGSSAGPVAPRVEDRPTAQAEQPRHGGPDLGWALACGGLLLAAAILTLGGRGGDEARRGRARLATLFRPLLGRR
jgi:murein DD-endopeptidase MepM/ murein hydrolase activator NlpD